jgi:VWFA-related protein
MLRVLLAMALSAPIFGLQQLPEVMPVIRSTTRLVEIEVLVSDKRGSVTGLTADDFLVMDRGKRQAVRLFESRPAVSKFERSSTIPAEAFSNRPKAGSAPPTITILLLDGLNTRFEDQNRARQQVIRALGTINLGEKGRIAIFVLGKSLRVLIPRSVHHRFTSASPSGNVALFGTTL